jgi:hypothetical protein
MTIESLSNQEIWLPISSFEGFYLISSLGRVQSLPRVIYEHNGKPRRIKGRIVTPKRTGKYLGVHLFKNAQGKRHYLHRLVAEAFIPNPENKPCVNHKDFDRDNNRVENLEWVTHEENTLHSAAADRLGAVTPKRGSECHSARFNDETVAQIRREWRRGQTAEFARRYGVTWRAMDMLIRGRTWRHIDPAAALDC